MNSGEDGGEVDVDFRKKRQLDSSEESIDGDETETRKKRQAEEDEEDEEEPEEVSEGPSDSDGNDRKRRDVEDNSEYQAGFNLLRFFIIMSVASFNIVKIRKSVSWISTILHICKSAIFNIQHINGASFIG